MYSYIETSGYGYNKQLCEDVCAWFIEQYMPRHHLYIDVVHRGLKRENAIGFCDYTGESYRPREFLIELQSNMERSQYIMTLIHELVHVHQWVTGSLKTKRGKMYYGTTNVEDLDYEDQPHEIEAKQKEVELYWKYVQDSSSSVYVTGSSKRVLL